jgi:hypothetical protein
LRDTPPQFLWRDTCLSHTQALQSLGYADFSQMSSPHFARVLAVSAQTVGVQFYDNHQCFIGPPPPRDFPPSCLQAGMAFPMQWFSGYSEEMCVPLSRMKHSKGSLALPIGNLHVQMCPCHVPGQSVLCACGHSHCSSPDAEAVACVLGTCYLKQRIYPPGHWAPGKELAVL